MWLDKNGQIHMILLLQLKCLWSFIVSFNQTLFKEKWLKFVEEAMLVEEKEASKAWLFTDFAYKLQTYVEFLSSL